MEKGEGILNRVIPLIHSLIKKEKKARLVLLNDHRIVMEDKVHRAIGILSTARILNSMECLDLLSTLRLGNDMKIINNISNQMLNTLMLLAQPAHIQKLEGKALSEMEKNRQRAELIRKNYI